MRMIKNILILVFGATALFGAVSCKSMKKRADSLKHENTMLVNENALLANDQFLFKTERDSLSKQMLKLTKDMESRDGDLESYVARVEAVEIKNEKMLREFYEIIKVGTKAIEDNEKEAPKAAEPDAALPPSNIDDLLPLELRNSLSD
jgi:hypothetical protein